LQAALLTCSEDDKPRLLALITRMQGNLDTSEVNKKELQDRMTEMEKCESLKKILKVMRAAEQCDMDTSPMKSRYEYLVQQTIESENLDKMQQQIVILRKYGKDTTALQRGIDKQKLDMMCQEADGFPIVSLGLDLESSSGSDGDDEEDGDAEGGDAKDGDAKDGDAKDGDADDDQEQSVAGDSANVLPCEVIVNDAPPDVLKRGKSVAIFINDRNGNESSFTLRPGMWNLDGKVVDGKPATPTFLMFNLRDPDVKKTLGDMLGDLKARIGLESPLKYETLQSMLWHSPCFKLMKCMFVSPNAYKEDGKLKQEFITEQKAFFETVLFKLEFVWECILSLCDPRPTGDDECKKILQAKVAEIEKNKQDKQLKAQARKQKQDGKKEDGKKKRKSQEHLQTSDSSYVRKKHRNKKSEKKARYDLKSSSESSD